MSTRLPVALLALAAAAAPLAADRQGASPDLVATAVADGRFETLAAALEAAGLVEALQGAGPFTVLAPTDEAFAAVPQATLEALLRPENRDQLARVLKLHVVPGRLTGAQALAAGEAATLAGERLTFGLRDGRLNVGQARVLANDVAASNGLIHVIDRVLLPAGGLGLRPQGRLVIGVYVEKPGRALASQLRIDREATLLVDSLSKAGPAARAGIEPYDVILSIDGAAATEAELRRAKERVGAGGTLALSILRRGLPRQVEVPVGVERH